MKDKRRQSRKQRLDKEKFPMILYSSSHYSIYCTVEEEAEYRKQRLDIGQGEVSYDTVVVTTLL